MEKLKKQLALMTMVVLALQLVTIKVSNAMPIGDVVINEIAWAGTEDGSNDEWIELYNTSGEAVDLSGWTIEDDETSTYTIESGEIAARGYFVIADSEVVFDGDEADVIVPLSLANAGDRLVLKDAAGNVVDEVNSAGDDWFAGDSGSKASMERIDPSADGDSEENWADAVNGNGAIGRDGSEILGTPGSVNSTFAGGGPAVRMAIDNANAGIGEFVNVIFEMSEEQEVYAYGFEVNYDADVLRFASATEGDFLNSDGGATSFNVALENGEEGRVIVGNSRIVEPVSGITATGELLRLEFEVIGLDGSAAITFGGSSFVADTAGDLAIGFEGDQLNIGGNGEVAAVENLRSEMSDDDYALELNWQTGGDGDYFIVERRLFDGTFVTLGETEELSFVDSDDVDNGGRIVPGVSYEYQVTAVKDGVRSAAVNVHGLYTRGIKGDNDRSGRVDGRDLERLARSFGAQFGEEHFDALLDTTYDGIIDGSDLIDIGINFGIKR